MIFKSTKASREWWAKFLIGLQKYNIIDSSGRVVPKREAFDLYFNEEGSQVMLELIMSDKHHEYSLIIRKDFDESITRTQMIEDVTREILKERAVKIFRNVDNYTDTLDSILELMVLSMMDAMDHKKIIECDIKKKVEYNPTFSSGNHPGTTNEKL